MNVNLIFFAPVFIAEHLPSLLLIIIVVFKLPLTFSF